MPFDDDSKSAAKDAKPRPVTREWLVRAAGLYLGRYASSQENLRRVLRRKVARRTRDADAGEEAGSHDTLVDEVIAQFAELKLLDDAAYAEARVTALRRRGAPARQIAAKLREKGVDPDIVGASVDDSDPTERKAAIAYARRRRLGCHGGSERAERRDKDIAAMTRAGFSLRHAIAAIDGTEGEF
ncbi:regulatory protein RecX [Consotaella aegiceratis]|uniref:regulatory protein RecX n=1 Tax=Consotaella aegiceratis TaxID=3097961 RepID=UPI002F3EB97D